MICVVWHLLGKEIFVHYKGVIVFGSQLKYDDGLALWMGCDGEPGSYMQIYGQFSLLSLGHLGTFSKTVQAAHMTISCRTADASSINDVTY